MSNPRMIWAAATAATVVGGGLLARVVQRRAATRAAAAAAGAAEPRERFYVAHGVRVTQGSAAPLHTVEVHGIRVTRTPPPLSPRR
jgi:hypothetical protein